MAVVRQKAQGILGLVEETLKIALTLGEDRFLWYRGLSDATLTLLPKLMRDGRTANEIFDRERRLLTRFRQRSLPYWPTGYPQNDWEHLFAMQHYGLPTRLLDWSENLFVAAHFAVAEVSELRQSGTPVIWCLDPIGWNRATPVLSEYGEAIQVLTTTSDEADSYRPESNRKRNKSPVAIFGTHNSDRIVAQRGTFTVWGDEVRSMEEFAKQIGASLWCIEVEGDRASLARELNMLGFGETMVFPELSSLAKELSRVEGWRTLV